MAAMISQAFKRSAPNDRLKMMNECLSSLEECKYYLVLCEDLKYGHSEQLVDLSEELEGLVVDYKKSMHHNLSLNL